MEEEADLGRRGGDEFMEETRFWRRRFWRRWFWRRWLVLEEVDLEEAVGISGF